MEKDGKAVSPDKRFHRWMNILVSLFFIAVLYVILADRHAPLTTESQVQGTVVQITPQVTGQIIKRFVSNNQHVDKGQPLFEIDPAQYQLAVQKAEVGLSTANSEEASLYAQMAAANANANKAAVERQISEKNYRRISTLRSKKLVSDADFDVARTQAKTASDTYAAALRQVEAIQSRLGTKVGDSNIVKSAQNALSTAKLNLSRTIVYAPDNGMVSNIQYDIGTEAVAGHPILSFIPSDSLWVSADFREKSVSGLMEQTKALVSFDALPGRVFDFTLGTRDAGVASAQQFANGDLSKVMTSNRWIRDAQRIRVNLSSDSALPKPLFVGSRATVTLYPEASTMWYWLAQLQIHTISLLHYIY